MPTSQALAVRRPLRYVNTALTELTYTSDPNHYGDEAITIKVNDLGSNGVRRARYLGGSIAAGGSDHSLVTTATIAMGIRYVNAVPVLSANRAKTVPIGAAVALAGGTYVPATSFYPPAITRLANSYHAPVPSNAGTTATGTSNLVAQDVEIKQASGLTYTSNLPVTQGALRLSRPDQAVLDLVAGTTFTQNDLNNGYVTYTHNGALTRVVNASDTTNFVTVGLSDGTRAVRRRQPNRFGLFDMLGNVSEWCVDRSGAYSPVGRLDKARIARGGAWADPPRTLRVANRLSLKPELRTLYVGFRFAMTARPQGKEPQRPEAAEVSST